MADRFARLRHGLIDHIPDLSDAELRVFITMLIEAEFSGPNKGVYIGSQRQLAKSIGRKKSTASRGLLDLASRGWIAKAGDGRYQIVKYDTDGAAPKPSRQRDSSVPLQGQGVPPAGQQCPATGTGCPATGTDCPASGTHTPYTGVLDIDFYIEWPRFLETYPKQTHVQAARAAFQNHLADNPNFPAVWPRIMAAADLLAEQAPEGSIQFLPGMREFIEDRWADDWAAWVSREKAKNNDKPKKVKF